MLHMSAGNELGRLGCRRREHHLDARRVLDEDRLDHVRVRLLEGADEVGDGLRLRAHVQDDRDVAERQAAVDEDDGLVRGLVQGDREVGRDGRPPDPALRGEEGDDLAGLARRRGWPPARGAGRGGGLRRGRVARPADLFELVDVADGVDELVGGERLHEELARAGEHRAAQIILLALDGHHDDRRLGNGVRDDLGRGDPVHVGHVDVHEDHVRPFFLRHVDGLLSTARGRRDFHVGLESDELREVFARVGDVVDDQDADLFAVGHAPTLPP